MSPLALGFTLAVLVIGAAVLSAAEVLLSHTTRARATTLADEGVPRADQLIPLLASRQTNVGVLVILRVALEVAAVSFVVVEIESRDLDTPTRLGAVILTFVVVALVQSLAKVAALGRAEALVRRITPVARLATALVPLRLVVGAAAAILRGPGTSTDDDDGRPQVSEEELLAFAEVAVEAAAIEEEEHALIESIIEFGDTIVREVMVPRPDMVTVEVQWRVSDVMEVVILNGFSRIPVTGEGIDDVVGIAYAKDLMRAERDGRGHAPVGDHVRGARFVPEQQRVSSLLPEMQVEQFHMAIVVDEYGGVAGLVTLEDLIEELVGEIVDEYDVEDPMAEPLPGGAFRINARMPLDEVNDLLEADLPEGDWDTLGGLLFAALGHVPANGESIDLEGYRLTAARVQGRRISMVRIDRATSGAES